MYDIDWHDLEAVCTLARRVGGWVVQYPDREWYNILPCDPCGDSRYVGAVVVYHV